MIFIFDCVILQTSHCECLLDTWYHHCINIATKYSTSSGNAETKDFARLTSHPVRGWTGKNKAFCSPAGTLNGIESIKILMETFRKSLHKLKVR